MEVKIYREPENESLIYKEEDLNEYNQLIAELGLKTPAKKEEACPIVYIHLNSGMERQLAALCPTRTAVEQYTLTAIPLQVLQTLKFAKDQEMFDGYQIWSANDQPDPLLIGWKWQTPEDKEKNYTWRVDRYLLARWGDCALELTELLKLGFEKIKEEMLDKTKKTIITCNAILQDPDGYVREMVAGRAPDTALNISALNTIY